MKVTSKTFSSSWESTAFGNFQPCPKGSAPAHIEPGVGFQVISLIYILETFLLK